MTYQSYSNKKKLENIYKQTQKNQNDIEQLLKKVNTNFVSVNNIKTGDRIELLNHIEHNYGDTYSVVILDIPDSMISFFKLDMSFSLSPDDFAPLAYDITKEKDFVKAFAEGTLHDGDISLARMENVSWWIKQSNGWQFYYRPGIIVHIASGVSEFGYSGDSIPVYITTNLYFLNDKDYNSIQSGK